MAARTSDGAGARGAPIQPRQCHHFAHTLSPPFLPPTQAAPARGGARASSAHGAAAGAGGGGGGERDASYSRKDKSLSLLCESFMLYCSSASNCPGGVVSLDTCAAHLGVERRRIYDVTNILGAPAAGSRVKPGLARARARRGAARWRRAGAAACAQLAAACAGGLLVPPTRAPPARRRRPPARAEALDMVSRKTKNAYIWHGTAHMPHTIKALRVRRLAACRRRMHVAAAAAAPPTLPPLRRRPPPARTLRSRTPACRIALPALRSWSGALQMPRMAAAAWNFSAT